jgi:hypothetical protein
MMAINNVVTSSEPQDHRNAVTAEIGSSIMAVFLTPTPAFEIDFAHPHRDLGGNQIRYYDGPEMFGNVPHAKSIQPWLIVFCCGRRTGALIWIKKPGDLTSASDRKYDSYAAERTAGKIDARLGYAGW